MKKFLSIIALIVCSATLMYGCDRGNKGYDVNPPSTSTVISNGGSSVVKGEYLYFINGYVSASTLTNAKTQNVFGSVVNGAIYRTKFDGDVSSNEDGTLTQVEVVVPKVVGFENGGFYIYDDYIYYTTPNMQDDKSGNLLNDTVDFCRIKIDGTGNTVIASAINVGKGQWKAYKLNGQVYFVVYSNNSLYSITTTGKNSGSIITMSNDVTSAYLPEEDIYSISNPERLPEYEGRDQVRDYNKELYFTTSLSDKDAKSYKGNMMYRCQIGSSDKKVVFDKSDYSYSIVDQKDGYLFYTVKNNKLPSDKAVNVIYRAEISGGLKNTTKISDSDFTTYYILGTNNNETQILVYQDSVLKVMLNHGRSSRVLQNGTITILKVEDNQVYYMADNQLYKLDINYNKTTLATSSKTIDTTKTEYFDKVQNTIFMMVTYTSENGTTSTYLNLIDETTNTEMKFVGNMENSHLPKQPEEEGTKRI